MGEGEEMEAVVYKYLIVEKFPKNSPSLWENSFFGYYLPKRGNFLRGQCEQAHQAISPWPPEKTQTTPAGVTTPRF